ncbi:hypothetical protein QR46_2919 [Giardia duodenalis assemblage B]|uniref:Uncharacterized protein n=2 Tax=Giardia intestinalis TaxID=5741 RepID=A0A132NSL6_GIAIN|nr:Hypothetical protein GSB_153590 [Giardia intestinalis]KWX13094.1 hypothetical protein QR46_2919 [Giardia intestinalis assemblage B]
MEERQNKYQSIATEVYSTPAELLDGKRYRTKNRNR